MTIQDAISRAKALHRERRARERLDEVRDSSAFDSATVVAAVQSDLETVRSRAAQPPLELSHVSVDIGACEKYGILATQGQVSRLPAADAAYRMLRSRLQQHARTKGWSCIGVTSPESGDGKTLTTLNLALSLAREKQRPIFLLDLDMRNPSVFKYLGASPLVSLENYFLGHASASEVIFRTDFDGLMVAGSTGPVVAASELIATTKFDELLAIVRTHYPEALTLIDLPPINSTDEALLIAPRIDAKVMVVRQGVTKREALERAIRAVGEYPLAGIVLNDSADAAASAYYSR
jgi:capsular exopolysaccharide synthesis family protein